MVKKPQLLVFCDNKSNNYNTICSTGKTSLVLQLIRNRHEWFDKPSSRVIFLYNFLQPELVQLKREDPNVILVDNLAEAKELAIKDSLLVIDDKQQEMSQKSFLNEVIEIFIRGVRHNEFNCVLLVQSLFLDNLRVIMNNCNYLVLFNSPRNKQGINFLAKQISPNDWRYIVDAYRHACYDKPFCYLVFDFTMATPERWRLRSSIYPSKDTILFSAS